MLASNRVECCPERFQMQAATSWIVIAIAVNLDVSK
jgi:hypothetical protein